MIGSTVPANMTFELVLQKYFGHSTFRPQQREAISQVLKGRDCVVIMATGGGKSICYQLPALITKKTAVVISPLISLMKDQVRGLRERGIRSEFVGSAQTDETVIFRAKNGEFDVLYMTPEKACSLTHSFWQALMRKGMSLLAIDEAHCVSEWGSTFRPAYQSIGWYLKPLLTNVPFIALTATATPKVREDIARSLRLENPYTAISSFDRPNIFYGVKRLATTGFLKEITKQVRINHHKPVPGSTIIYCTTVSKVDEVVDALQDERIDARAYHGQMKDNEERHEVQRAFSADEFKVVVATLAFGMGIDKPDIRTVIHFGCPKSLEAYYQESGRAGRDGLPSECWLYYTRRDFTKTEFYIQEAKSPECVASIQKAYSAAQKYCITVDCRRSTILKYFGEPESSDNCNNCDNCNRLGGTVCLNFTREARIILEAVKAWEGRSGIGLPIDVLMGSKKKKVTEHRYDQSKAHGSGKHLKKSSNWWKCLADQLQFYGYLQEVPNPKFRLIRLAERGEQFLQSNSYVKVMLPISQEMEEEYERQGIEYILDIFGVEKDKKMDKQLQGYDLEDKSDEKVVKNKDKGMHEKTIFGGLGLGDIIWRECDGKIEKKNNNQGIHGNAHQSQTGPSEARRGIDLHKETPENKKKDILDLASINNVELSSGMKVPYALVDTRFLPGRVGDEPLTTSMLKDIYDAFRKSQFSKLLNLPKMWTFIGTQEDAKFLRSSLGSIFLDKKGFNIEESFYKPHHDEEIQESCKFFEGPILILLHVFWPEENGGTTPTTSGPMKNGAMKRFHIAEDLPRYMFPETVKKEQEHVLFKSELRFQSYIDLIGPMSIPQATFLNICGGNKPHLVASAFKMKILSIVPKEYLSEATNVSQKVLSLDAWSRTSERFAQELHGFLTTRFHDDSGYAHEEFKPTLKKRHVCDHATSSEEVTKNHICTKKEESSSYEDGHVK